MSREVTWTWRSNLGNKVVSDTFPASWLLPIFNFKSINPFHEGLLKAGHCVPPPSKKLLVSLTFEYSKKKKKWCDFQAEIDFCYVHKCFLSFQMKASSPCSEKHFKNKSSLPLFCKSFKDGNEATVLSFQGNLAQSCAYYMNPCKWNTRDKEGLFMWKLWGRWTGKWERECLVWSKKSNKTVE